MGKFGIRSKKVRVIIQELGDESRYKASKSHTVDGIELEVLNDEISKLLYNMTNGNGSESPKA